MFPPIVGHMVKIGEAAGERRRRLMVDVIIIAMYMPMFKMLTLVK